MRGAVATWWARRVVAAVVAGLMIAPLGARQSVLAQSAGSAAQPVAGRSVGSAQGAVSPAGQPQAAATVPPGRRDLFAPPAGAVKGTTHAIPSSDGPSLGTISLPPLPGSLPGGPTSAPPSLSGKGGQGAAATPPEVELQGIALGSTPQAVLASDKTYAIVTVGQKTDWGTVTGITATTVTLKTDTGSRTLTIGHSSSTTSQKGSK